MKIEMCEQMVAAWLRYCKGCQIVQTNWTPTPEEVDGIDPEEVKRYVDICNVTLEDEDVDLFGNSREQQIVTQCEIDVIGVHVEAGKVDKLYLIDTAFHINGLNYKDNKSRVLKKFLRAALISRLFFCDINCEVIFASPFCRKAESQKIEECLTKLDAPALACQNIQYSLYVNTDFAKHISQPLKDMMADIADSNALYLRALQLDAKCEEFADQGSLPAPVTKKPAKAESQSGKTPKGGNKKVVLPGLRRLIDAGVLHGELLNNLCSTTYTRNTFKISTYPALIPIDAISRECSIRFYPEVLEIDGGKYRVCNQWTQERMERFIPWLDKMEQSIQ